MKERGMGEHDLKMQATARTFVLAFFIVVASSPNLSTFKSGAKIELFSFISCYNGNI